MKRRIRAIALLLSMVLLSTALTGCVLDELPIEKRKQMLPRQFFGEYYQVYESSYQGKLAEGYDFDPDSLFGGTYPMTLNINKKSRLQMGYGDSSWECLWKAFKDGSIDVWWNNGAGDRSRTGLHAQNLIYLANDEHENSASHRVFVRTEIDLTDPAAVLKKAAKPTSFEMTQDRKDLFWSGLDAQYFEGARDAITPVAYMGTIGVKSGTDHIFLCSVNDFIWIDTFQIFFIRERKDGSCLLDGRINTNICCEVEAWYEDGTGYQYQYKLEEGSPVPEKVTAAIRQSLGSNYEPMALISTSLYFDRCKVLCLHGKKYEVVKVSFNEDGSHEILQTYPMIHEYSETDEYPIRNWTVIGKGWH